MDASIAAAGVLILRCGEEFQGALDPLDTEPTLLSVLLLGERAHGIFRSVCNVALPLPASPSNGMRNTVDVPIGLSFCFVNGSQGVQGVLMCCWHVTSFAF